VVISSSDKKNRVSFFLIFYFVRDGGFSGWGRVMAGQGGVGSVSDVTKQNINEYGTLSILCQPSSLSLFSLFCCIDFFFPAAKSKGPSQQHDVILVHL